MKKWFTLLGVFFLVGGFGLCAFSVSAKEKLTSKSDLVVTNVSHETLAAVIISPDYVPYSPVGNDFAVITRVLFDFYTPEFNDPYLERSQRWLKERNSEATAILWNRKTGYNPGIFSQKLNC